MTSRTLSEIEWELELLARLKESEADARRYRWWRDRARRLDWKGVAEIPVDLDAYTDASIQSAAPPAAPEGAAPQPDHSELLRRAAELVDAVLDNGDVDWYLGDGQHDGLLEFKRDLAAALRGEGE